MFSDTVNGAQSSANLYFLIETARANGLEPYAYLGRVFTLLPQATAVADIEALLPWHPHEDSTESEFAPCCLVNDWVAGSLPPNRHESRLPRPNRTRGGWGTDDIRMKPGSRFAAL